MSSDEFIGIFRQPTLSTPMSQETYLSRKDNQLFITENTFPVEMATRNKRKLAALYKENGEEHLGRNLEQN